MARGSEANKFYSTRRPYFSGQIKIALVYLPIYAYSASRKSSQIDLDLIDRKTHERIHYANVLESGKRVNPEDIVKGYKAESGNYVLLEPEEIKAVKLPSSEILEITEFVRCSSLSPVQFKRTLYLLPKDKTAEEIYTTLRDALKKTAKVGIGQLTIRGREELCALMPHENGLVLELLHYEDELKDAQEFFKGIGESKKTNAKMAEDLIKASTAKLDLSKYENHYHEALMELINSKKEERKPEYKAPEPGPKNVINFMDALRKSLANKSKPVKGAKTPGKPKSKSRKR